MYVKISGGSNKGGAGKLFDYLTKENDKEGKPEDFFNSDLYRGKDYKTYADLRQVTVGSGDKPNMREIRKDVIFQSLRKEMFERGFDKHSHQGIPKNSAKFYMVTISPSHKELCNLIGVKPEDVKSKKDLTQEQINLLQQKLKCYTNDVMNQYAIGFNRPEITSEKDLLYYAKIESTRTYRHYDKDVIEGKKHCGEEKQGLNYHVHVVVSRKSANGKVKLSPINHNTSSKSKQVTFSVNGSQVRRGFDMSSFQEASKHEFYNSYYQRKPFVKYFEKPEKQDVKGKGVAKTVTRQLTNKLIDKNIVKHEIKAVNGTVRTIKAVAIAAIFPTPMNVIKAVIAPVKAISKINDFEK